MTSASPSDTMVQPLSIRIHDPDRVRGSVDAELKFINHKWRAQRQARAYLQSAYPITRHFLDTTTLHALPRLLRSNHKLAKLAWFIIFVGATVCMIYHCAMLVQRYNEHPHTVMTSLTNSEVLEFPAVTICNRNRIKQSSIAKDTHWSGLLLLEKEIPCTLVETLASNFALTIRQGVEMACKNKSSFIRSSLFQPTLLSQKELRFEAENPEEMARIRFFTDLVRKGSENSDMTDILDTIVINPPDIVRHGFSAQELIVECSFDRANCSQLDFTHIYNKRYGNCYTFNSGLGKMRDARAVQSHRYGAQYGLRLTMNIQANESVGLLAADFGSRVAVHKRKTIAYPHMDGFNAPPGFLTEVSIKVTQLRRLSQPFKSDCVDEFSRHVARKLLPQEAVYSYSACLVACKDAHLYQECACIDRSAEILDVYNELNPELYPRCDLFNKTQTDCRRKLYDELYRWNDVNKGLECDCRPPCMETIYKRSISQTIWPSINFQLVKVLNNHEEDRVSQLFLDDVMEHLTPLRNTTSTHVEMLGYAHKNLVRLHVCLEDPTSELMEEMESYPMKNLLADIGGVIGLYLGLSIATIFEILEYLLNLLLGFSQTRRKNNTFV